MSSLKEADKAPDFRLAAEDGTELKLKDFSGKFLLLYFFPKALTPG